MPPKKSDTGFDMSKIKAEIAKEIKTGKIEKHEGQIKEQRAPVEHSFLKDGAKTVKKGIKGKKEKAHMGGSKYSS